MQAVILAAGMGLRLRPFTETQPKGLVPIAGKPLLKHTLNSLPEKVSEIFIVIGYRGNQIQDYFGNSYNGTPIHYTTQDPLTGTGSAIHTVRDLLHESFLVVNGDDLYARQDLENLTQHERSILVHETAAGTGHTIVTDTAGNLTDIAPANPNETKRINCGAYYFDTNFFNYPLVEIPVRGGVEYSLPHTLVEYGKDYPVYVVIADFWLPVGTPEQLEAANQALAHTL